MTDTISTVREEWTEGSLAASVSAVVTTPFADHSKIARVAALLQEVTEAIPAEEHHLLVQAAAVAIHEAAASLPAPGVPCVCGNSLVPALGEEDEDGENENEVYELDYGLEYLDCGLTVDDEGEPLGSSSRGDRDRYTVCLLCTHCYRAYRYCEISYT